MSPLFLLACAGNEQLENINNAYVQDLLKSESSLTQKTAIESLGVNTEQAQVLENILKDGKIDDQDQFTLETGYTQFGICWSGSNAGHGACGKSVFSDAQIVSLKTLGNQPALALIDKILASKTDDLPEQFPVLDLLTENLSSEKMAELSPLQIQNALIWLLANTADGQDQKFIQDLIANNPNTKTVLAEMDAKLAQDPNSFGYSFAVWGCFNDTLAQNGLHVKCLE